MPDKCQKIAESSQKDFPGKLILVLPLLLIGRETGKQMFNQSKSRVAQDHSNQENPPDAQFRIALLQLDHAAFTVLNFKAPCKKSNVVGQQLPTLMDVTCCALLHPSPPRPHSLLHVLCVSLGVVAQSLKPVKLLATRKRTQQLPMLRTFARGLRLHYHFYLTRISLPLITLNNTGSLFVPITVWLVRKTQKQHLVTQLI